MEQNEKNKLINEIRQLYEQVDFSPEEFRAINNQNEKHKFEIVVDKQVEKINFVLALMLREFINREILDPKVGFNQTDGTRALHKFQINSMKAFKPTDPPEYLERFITKYSLIIIYLFFSKFEGDK